MSSFAVRTFLLLEANSSSNVSRSNQLFVFLLSINDNSLDDGFPFMSSHHSLLLMKSEYRVGYPNSMSKPLPMMYNVFICFWG